MSDHQGGSTILVDDTKENRFHVSSRCFHLFYLRFVKNMRAVFVKPTLRNTSFDLSKHISSLAAFTRHDTAQSFFKLLINARSPNPLFAIFQG